MLNVDYFCPNNSSLGIFHNDNIFVRFRSNSDLVYIT